MELTRKQEEGLRIAVDRYRKREPYTVIAGYAGTGKSTLINFIVSALELNDEQVAYITFTGKASEVLREKGCPNAMTAHKLLYYSRQLPNGKFVYKPVENLHYELIVVDEVSMLPMEMWELLLSYHVYVIACGDPFQIPPIQKDQDNHVLDNPHIFLDEIMRQARESDIINLSMDIREGRRIVPFKGNDVQVYNKRNVVSGMYFWADQILVATNKSRFEINDYMRLANDRGTEPELGDKVICLRNCWDTLSERRRDPLINGTIGYIVDMQYKMYPYHVGYQVMEAPILTMAIDVGGDIVSNIDVDYTALTTGQKFFSPEQEYKIKRNKQNPCGPPIEFNYGYAITGHRAQGSQWDNVLTFEEGFPFDKEEHARWLYTMVTRAARKLTLILR